ncbi:DUF7112 family protein [Salinarchaeum laminariae]|uniref:DUF7112 family protein n=1 Tax=Salinarchaeum laminariae TaxID=869888 RepID=UPI0020C18875|nr:hypothetical protein [Salinarchaeum laminariae]
MNRVRSEGLQTIDASLVGHGAIDRPAIELPTDVDTGPDGPVPTDEILRIVLDGATRHCRFETYSGSVRATGVFDTSDLVRSPGDGENRLREWLGDAGLSLGRTVHLDVIEAGFAYGLRAPGESIVYDAPSSSPDDSLASIAEQLDGE